MRIVYAALDQTVPGTLGGSVHVQSVSEGLAALGHDVHVAVQPGGPWPAGRVRWHPMAPPLGSPYLRSLRRGAALNSTNAIIGIILLVWSHEKEPGSATVPKQFGYRALTASVNVPVTLEATQRASMFVFVYPLTPAASAHLPDHIEDAVQID